MRHFTQLSFLLLACVLFLNGCGQADTANAGSAIVEPPNGTNASQVTLTVLAGENDIKTTVVPFKEGMTIGAYIDAQSGLKFVMKDYPGMGRLVTAINGTANEDTPEHFWQFCINGVVSDKGIDAKQLAAGDLVQWHYVRYGETPCKKIGE